MQQYNKLFIERILFNNIDYDMLLNKHSLTRENYNCFFLKNSKEPVLSKEPRENNRMKKKQKFLTKLRNKIEEGKELSYYDIVEKDFFFWSWYVMSYGEDEYKNIKNKFQLERELRYEYIDKVRERKQELKKIYKIDVKKVVEILGNMNVCDFNTFKALCILSKLNVCIENNDIVSCIVYDEKEFYHILYHENRYNLSIHKVDNKYIENHYRIENLDKPLYSMSHYKVKDLIEICDKLMLNTKNKKKSELYESIKMKLREFNV